MPKHQATLLAAALAALLPLALAGQAQAAPGDIYVSDCHTRTIERFTPGGVASVFASTGLNDPQGLAFDASGNLYAVNAFGDTIEKFTPDGAASQFASTGLIGITSLAIEPAAATPVPEPASATLLGLGLCALGALRHRRNA